MWRIVLTVLTIGLFSQCLEVPIGVPICSSWLTICSVSETKVILQTDVILTQAVIVEKKGGDIVLTHSAYGSEQCAVNRLVELKASGCQVWNELIDRDTYDSQSPSSSSFGSVSTFALGTSSPFSVWSSRCWVCWELPCSASPRSWYAWTSSSMFWRRYAPDSRLPPVHSVTRMDSRAWACGSLRPSVPC